MARILIVGGSLGGLMAANLLWRDGHEVAVFEKALGEMDGRGAGIVTHSALIAGLHRCGLPLDTVFGVPVNKRVTLDSTGHVVAELAMPQVLTSWSRLYQLLHAQLPSRFYHQGVAVQGVEQNEQGIRVSTHAGMFDADVLIASDGIRSAIRAQWWPGIKPIYAGYVAWRGVCDENLLSARTRDTVFNHFGFCLPEGEQLIGYPVAGASHHIGVGQRAYNVVWYRPALEGEQLAALMTDAEGIHHPQGIAPHKVSAQNIAQMRADAHRLLAPQFAEIIQKTALPFLQPIYDLASPALVNGRVALMGDAAFVARPHVGMGVTKAMQDAVALTDAIHLHGANQLALQAYEKARLAVGHSMVERGRRLGAYMQASNLHANVTQVRDAAEVMRETAIDLDIYADAV